MLAVTVPSIRSDVASRASVDDLEAATGSAGEAGGLQIALPSPDHSRLRASGKDKAEKAGLEVKAQSRTKCKAQH